MVEIKYFERNNRYAISFKGHAEYAPHGQDIVCASISAVTSALAYYLEDHAADENWIVLESRLDEGDANIEILDDSDSGIALHLYKMTMEALETIADNYPHNVRIVH